jgi:hypothetical protein
LNLPGATCRLGTIVDGKLSWDLPSGGSFRHKEITFFKKEWTEMKKMILIGMIGMLALSGCAAPQTNTGKGTAYGAAGGAVAGAVLGQAIGRNTKGTLIGAAAGAAVGAAAGAGVGKMMDRQEAEMRDALAASDAAAVRREGELLAITLKGDVSFDLDSDVVRPGLYNELDRIAQIMIKYPPDRYPGGGPYGQHRFRYIQSAAFRTAGQQRQEPFDPARGPGPAYQYPGLRREPPGGHQRNTGRSPDEPPGGNPHQSCQRPGIIDDQSGHRPEKARVVMGHPCFSVFTGR